MNQKRFSKILYLPDCLDPTTMCISVVVIFCVPICCLCADLLYCMSNELISLHCRTELTRFAHKPPIYRESTIFKNQG